MTTQTRLKNIPASGASAPAHVCIDDIRIDAPCYLLFAGVSDHPPLGGLGDLMRTFTCEAAAREAFHELRVQRVAKGTWAQLAMIDMQSGIRPVCWFGIGAASPARHVQGGSPDAVGAPQSAQKRRWMERYRRHAGRGTPTTVVPITDRRRAEGVAPVRSL